MERQPGGKPAILITTTSFGVFDDGPVARLKERGYEVVINPFGRKLKEAETRELLEKWKPAGIVAGTEKYPRDLLHDHRYVKIISRVGVGVDGVDLAAAKELGIAVSTTPDGPTDAVAELTVGLILAVLRKIASADRQLRGGAWRPAMGELLTRKTVGMVGFGRIARRTAAILERGFGASIAAFDPFVKDAPAKLCGSLDELLPLCDVVSLHLPGGEKTKGIIGRNELQKMKRGAVLINCARGGLVDEAALAELLAAGHLGGAGLDVFENEPYKGPLALSENTVLTMHMGSYAKGARIAMETEAVDNLLRHLSSAEG